MNIIDQLEQQIKHRKQLAENLMQTVLREATGMCPKPHNAATGDRAKAKRVKHLQNDISVMSLEIVAQMLNPYRWISLIQTVLREAFE